LRNKLGIRWLGLIGIVTILVIWEGLSLFFPPVILPSVEEVLFSLGDLILNNKIWKPLSYTVTRILIGFGLSLVIGGVLGLLAGLVKWVYEFTKPIIVVIENTPPLIWVVIAIVWFGLGNIPPILAIVSIAGPVIAVNLSQGVRDIDPNLKEMAQSFGVKKTTKLRHLYLPAIAGPFFSAMSIGLGLTWRVVIMAEFFGSMTGVGYKINAARHLLETEEVFAYTLILIVLGLLMEYGLINPLQRMAMKWQQG